MGGLRSPLVFFSLCTFFPSILSFSSFPSPCHVTFQKIIQNPAGVPVASLSLFQANSFSWWFGPCDCPQFLASQIGNGVLRHPLISWSTKRPLRKPILVPFPWSTWWFEGIDLSDQLHKVPGPGRWRPSNFKTDLIMMTLPTIEDSFCILLIRFLDYTGLVVEVRSLTFITRVG